MQSLLFSTPMVQALMADRKTETRRGRGLRAINENPDKWRFQFFDDDIACFTDVDGNGRWSREAGTLVSVKCPFKLGYTWVRETYRVAGWNLDDNDIRFEYKDGESQNVELDGDEGALWLADRFEKIQYELECKGVEPIFTSEEDYHFTAEQIKKLSWSPSIHMPFIAARNFIHIDEIKLERIQDITEDGAIADGIQPLLASGMQLASEGKLYRDYMEHTEGIFGNGLRPLKSFKSLITSINGPEMWDKNEWVWVLKFHRIDKP